MGLLLLLPLAIIAGFVFVLWEPIRLIRRLRSAPARPLAALATGEPAKIFGRASGTAQRSPVAEASCIFWKLEVQEYRSSGRSGRWVTVREQSSSAPIAIDDDSGRVWAIPAGAKLLLGDDFRSGGGLFERLTPSAEAAIERMGLPRRGVFGFKRQLRVREWWISAGEPVLALGLAEQASGELRLCSTSAAPLLLADRDEGSVLNQLYGQVGLGLAFMVAGLALVSFLLR